MKRIDLNAIKTDPIFPSVVKMLALTMDKDTYLRPGKWLESLPDLDLAHLGEMADKLQDGDEKATMCLIAITILLSLGEGLEIEATEEETIDQLKYLSACLAMEKLARLGLIEFYRENVTFSPDGDKLELARVINAPATE